MSESELDPVWGLRVHRPLRVRILQYASLILAVAGLILLWLYSIHSDFPVVKIAEISPSMNFASVRICGEVARDAVVLDSGALVFNVRDDHGEISVWGARAQAETLVRAGMLPRRGDRIEVVGSLSVRAGQDLKLRLRAVNQLLIHHAQTDRLSSVVKQIGLADLTSAQAGESFSVIGTLTTITVPPPGSSAPYVLTLEEDGVELPVVFWNQVVQGLHGKFPAIGTQIRVCGRIEVYKKRIQLKLWDAQDLCEVEGEK